MNYILGHDSHGAPDHHRRPAARARSRPRSTASTTPPRTSSGCSTPSTPTTAASPRTSRSTPQPRHRQAEHFGAMSGVQLVRQDHRRRREDRRLHRERRLDRLHAVRPERRHLVHGPGLLGRRRRHPQLRAGSADRHAARHGHGAGDRRLGDLRQRHRQPDRRRRPAPPAVPGLHRRHGRAVRRRRLHLQQRRGAGDEPGAEQGGDRGQPVRGDGGPAKAVNGTVNGGNADKWCSVGASKWLRSTWRQPVRRRGRTPGRREIRRTSGCDIGGTTAPPTTAPRRAEHRQRHHPHVPASAATGTVNVLAPTGNTDTAARSTSSRHHQRRSRGRGSAATGPCPWSKEYRS